MSKRIFRFYLSAMEPCWNWKPPAGQTTCDTDQHSPNHTPPHRPKNVHQLWLGANKKKLSVLSVKLNLCMSAHHEVQMPVLTLIFWLSCQILASFSLDLPLANIRIMQKAGTLRITNYKTFQHRSLFSEWTYMLDCHQMVLVTLQVRTWHSMPMRSAKVSGRSLIEFHFSSHNSNNLTDSSLRNIVPVNINCVL